MTSPTQLSKMIILPTTDIEEDFYQDVRNMTNHCYDFGEVIRDVLVAMSSRNHIKENIQKTCDFIINSFDKVGARDDGIVLANGFANMAVKVGQILLANSDVAWDRSGKFVLKYRDSIGKDWLLEIVSPAQSKVTLQDLLNDYHVEYYSERSEDNENNT